MHCRPLPASDPAVHQSSCTLPWSTLEQNCMKDGMLDFSSSPRLIIVEPFVIKPETIQMEIGLALIHCYNSTTQYNIIT